MSKEILAVIKLQIIGGKANPAPPIGPALGQRQVNIMDFCKRFNDATKDMMGIPCPTIISVYKDKSFDFIVKKPPNTYHIKQLLKIESGSKTPGRVIVSKVLMSQLVKLAESKICDMNCYDTKVAAKTLAGSARSMGIEVVNDIEN